MGSEETDCAAQEIMAALDNVFLAEWCVRLQASALEGRQHALTATFWMVQEMEIVSAIDGVFGRFGFKYRMVDGDAKLWISERYGLMVFLFFTSLDGSYYNYRIVAFDVVGEGDVRTDCSRPGVQPLRGRSSGEIVASNTIYRKQHRV